MGRGSGRKKKRKKRKKYKQNRSNSLRGLRIRPRLDNRVTHALHNLPSQKKSRHRDKGQDEHKLKEHVTRRSKNLSASILLSWTRPYHIQSRDARSESLLRNEILRDFAFLILPHAFNYLHAAARQERNAPPPPNCSTYSPFSPYFFFRLVIDGYYIPEQSDLWLPPCRGDPSS